MVSEDDERLLQEAEERLRKKRELLAERRRAEALGAVVRDVAAELAREGETGPAAGKLEPPPGKTEDKV